jgi:soluble lytic murein transglycosylase
VRDSITNEFRAKRPGIFLPASVVFLAVLFSACSGAWGQSKGEILRSLETRDYAIFDEIDPARYGEATRLGDGAPYFIGLHLKLAGREEQARAMFEVGRSSAVEPYSGLCLRELASFGPAEARLASVELLLAASPNSADLLETRDRLRILAGRSDEVPGGVESWLLARPIDAELALSVSTLPSDSLSEDFMDMYFIRSLVALKDYAGAWDCAKGRLTADRVNPLVWRRGVLSDIGKAALYGSNSPEADASFLMGLVTPKKTDPALSFLPSFYASRLYAKADRIAKARAGYLKSIAAAKTPKDRDSACWYLLELDLKHAKEPDFAAFLADYRAYAVDSATPSWYDDLLESAIVGMVGARDWAGLETLRVSAAPGIDPELRARLGYIAARTALSGTERASVVLAEVAQMRRKAPYYALMANVALGREPRELREPLEPANDIAGEPSAKTGAQDDMSAYSFLRGYIEWYLPERLYQAAADLTAGLSAPISPQDAAKLADELTSIGRHGDAIRLVSLTLSRAGEFASFERILYPRPWATEISGSARRFGVDEWLLYAMIRSESLFQPGIVSGAGARGLTQLMEPTAVDIARELKYPSFDLSDPATNIEFGAYYLSRMIARLDGQILPACYAYNAGISRVRRWFDALAGLPADIALEGLPYGETREYGRKIIVSAAAYGRIYYDRAAGSVVGDILGTSQSPLPAANP